MFSSVLVLALAGIVAFIVIKGKSTAVSDPLKNIPADVAFLLRINDFSGLSGNTFKNNKVFTTLKNITPFKNLYADIEAIDSLTGINVDVLSVLKKCRLYISSHYIGGRKTEFLFIFENFKGGSDRQVYDIVSEITKQPVKDSERKYEGKSIFTLKVIRKNKPQSFYFSLVEGNLLLSRSVILIENAIRQSSMPASLPGNDEFARILTTAGKNKEVNLFINMRKFNGIISSLANNQYSSSIKEYDNFGGWIGLDLNTAEKQLILNGFISDGGDSESFHKIFYDNEPINLSAEKILPASVSSFLSVGAGNFTKLRERYLLYLQHEGLSENRKNSLAAFKKKYSVDLEESLLTFIDNEITVAWGSSTEEYAGRYSTFILIKCKSGALAKNTMEDLVRKVASGNGKKLSDFVTIHTVDADTKFSITELPEKNITGLLLGKLFSINGRNFYTVLDNYLVFSDSRNALGNFLYNNVLSKTLSTNEAYKAFNSSIAQNSFLICYSNLARSSRVYSKYLRENIIDQWENYSDNLQRIQPFGFQITRVSGMNYCNIASLYLDDLKGRHQTVWESLLDSVVTGKPYLVENHYTGQNEIFLQDMDNNIYLINKAGRIIWKQKITETINSKVYQVDYYKNGKLQLLFSSANYLHLIDRNGNYVDRYPLRLRAGATAGLSLFDYERNRDYRVFIPCNDKKVYAYDIKGNLIDGWGFNGSEYPVTQPVEHFRVMDKDFIVFGDRYSTYILDRKGNTRVTAGRVISKSQNNTYYLDDKGSLDNSHIVTTDTLGNIVYIDFKGGTEYVSIGKFSPEHYFDFKDMNGDNRKDYIFLDGNNLNIYSSDKNEIFNFSFSNDIKKPPVIFTFSSSNRKTGIVDETEKKIYLINKDGTLFKGFPLEGTSLFSIGNLDSIDGIFNLIVGGRNNFLYNYSVK